MIEMRYEDFQHEDAAGVALLSLVLSYIPQSDGGAHQFRYARLTRGLHLW